MRKGHWACLLLGVVVGIALGFGLVIMQIKYGRTPTAVADPYEEGIAHSEVKEPTALGGEITDDDDDPKGTAGQPSDSKAIVLGAPIQVPFGPVEVTMVHRPGGEAAVAEPHSPAPLDSDAEQFEQRMLNHLVRHMQTGGESEEATAELLPMPTEEPPAATASNQPACPFGTENLVAPG
jgi:hypothetical protein